MTIALDVRWLRRGMVDGIGQVVLSLVPELAISSEHNFILLYHEQSTREMLEPLLKSQAKAKWYRLNYPLLSLGELRLPTDLRRLGIDIYLTFNYPTVPFHSGYRAAAIVHDLIPFMVNGSQTAPQWKLFYATRWPTRRILSNLNLIIAPSKSTEKDLRRLFPGLSTEIVVSHWGVAPPDSELAPGGKRELEAFGIRPNYILYVGRYEPYKNVASLVRAYSELPPALRKAHQLVLAGNSSVKVQREFLRPGIVLTGQLKSLEAVYAGAEVFAYPSKYEGFGLPPLEAMTRSLPVITTNRASLPEILGDAALITDGSPGQLKDALEALLSDPALRSALAAKGKARAAEFTWQKTARRILAELVR